MVSGMIVHWCSAPLLDLVSHTFPLTKIQEAFETAEWVGKEGGSAATRVVVMAR